MTSLRVLVTGATGKTGRATVLELLARGVGVRALVHRLDARSAALKQAGAELVQGSLEDLQALSAAMAGVQRAYFCPPLEPGALRRAALFGEAAHEARLEAVVALSQWLVDPGHRSLHAREKWLAERLLSRLPGVGLVTVNPGFFADNYLAALESAAQLGVFAMPLGAGRNAPPSNEDIARVIAGLLIDPGPHLGKSYRPTGPTLLDPQAIAAAFGQALGRSVRYQDAPLPLFMKVARSLALPDYLVLQLRAFLEDYQRDAFAVGAPTDAVLRVGGREPEDFVSFVRRHAARSPVARPSLRGKLRALMHLVAALLTPQPDLRAISLRLQLPELPSAQLAADSLRWRASHG